MTSIITEGQIPQKKRAPQKKLKSIISKSLRIGLSLSFLMSTIDISDARHRHHRYHRAKHGHNHYYHHHAKRSGSYTPPYAEIVYDVNAGKVMTQINADAFRQPASITKVMTLYMLFEQLDSGRMSLDTELRISAHAASMPPSKLGLRVGSTISVEDAIKAVVTRSANDVASAIGENIAGSEEAFASQMTRKAHALGMNRTTFRNASGLPKPENITTARDLVTLGRAIQDRFPTYYKYFATHSFEYNGQVIGNHNRLLGRIEGVDGIKTGYTRASGFNLLTSAKIDGHHVIAVVLGGRSGRIRDAQMASLLDENLSNSSTGSRRNTEIAAVDAIIDAEESDIAPQKTPVVKSTIKPKPAVIAEVAPKPAKPAVQQVAMNMPKPANITGVSPTRSVQSVASTTPSGPNLRWNAGAKPLNQADIRVGQPTDPNARKAMGLRAEAEQAESITTGTVVKATSVKSGWIIQVAATNDESKALAILAAAKSKNKVLASSRGFTEEVHKGSTTLYRARFGGFENDSAETACKSLKRTGYSCFIQHI